MKQPGEWEVTRRRVALCGRVLGGNGRPANEARVSIIDAPKKFKTRMKPAPAGNDVGEGNCSRPNVTGVRPDGIYFFLDLPEGEYTVLAESPRPHERAENRGKVVRKKDGSFRIAVVDMQLDPVNSI